MTSPHYEIGVVYKKNSRFYLAVSDRQLISFKDGRALEVRPYLKYEVLRQITVNHLCDRWGIEIDQLDAVTRPYFSPAEEGIKPRPRGTRQTRAMEDHRWRTHRTIRLAS